MVGSGAVVEHSVGRDAEVGPDAIVGPFAVLEPGAQVPAGGRTGPFHVGLVPLPPEASDRHWAVASLLFLPVTGG